MKLHNIFINKSDESKSDTTQKKECLVNTNTHDKSSSGIFNLNNGLSTTAIQPPCVYPSEHKSSSVPIEYTTKLDEMRSLTSAINKDNFGAVKVVSLNEAVENIRLHMEELDAERKRRLEIEDNDPCCL